MSTESIGDYFYKDCRVFLSKFKNKESLRFDAFAEVWQEMKFSFVLTPWKYLGEMQEIVDEYLKVCKKIWLKSEAVEERVCGLYLLRVIYLKQPAAQFVKISLSHEDWQCMKHFLYVIKDFDQNETRYILQELFELNAFTFSVPDCMPVGGRNDGGLSECVLAQFSKAHSVSKEKFAALQRENAECKQEKRACTRIYPELRSFTSTETDSLIDQLMGRLTVFEEEVSKIKDNFLEACGTPGSSLHEDDNEGRKSLRRRVSHRVTTISDCCESEESSDDEDDSTNLDMPQLHSEDSDEGVKQEESCDVSTASFKVTTKRHMSDTELSTDSSDNDDDDESYKPPTSTSSRAGRPAAARQLGKCENRPRPAQRARRGRARRSNSL